MKCIFLFIGEHCFQGPRPPACGCVSVSVGGSVNGDQFKPEFLLSSELPGSGWGLVRPHHLVVRRRLKAKEAKPFLDEFSGCG